MAWTTLKNISPSIFVRECYFVGGNAEYGAVFAMEGFDILDDCSEEETFDEGESGGGPVGWSGEMGEGVKVYVVDGTTEWVLRTLVFHEMGPVVGTR